MAVKYFEQGFDYDFYPLKSDRCTYEVLPASPVSIYVYDGKPSEDDAAAGTTADGDYTLLETIATWSDTPDGLGKRIEVAAISEPSDYEGGYDKHYIVINTALDNPIPPIIKEIKMTRMTAQESVISVSISDVLGMEPNIELFCNKYGLCVGEIETYVEAAIREVKFALTDCELDFANVSDPGQLNLAVVYLAISKFYFGQSRDINDVFWGKSMYYREQHEKAIKGTHLQLDTDGDNIADESRSGPGGFISLRTRR